MATLDLLSDGRLELGIGAGWMTADYEKAGMPLDRPGVRIARLAESITVLKGLFADGPFTFHGEHYRSPTSTGCRSRCSAASAVPHRRRREEDPRPRGARGADRRHQREPASGDGKSPDAAQSLTPAATDQKLGWLREAAGAGFDDLEIQTLLGFVHVTDERVGDRRRRWRQSFGVDRDDALLAPVTLVGSESEIVELLEAAPRALADVVRRGARRRTRRVRAVVARLAGK